MYVATLYAYFNKIHLFAHDGADGQVLAIRNRSCDRNLRFAKSPKYRTRIEADNALNPLLLPGSARFRLACSLRRSPVSPTF